MIMLLVKKKLRYHKYFLWKYSSFSNVLSISPLALYDVIYISDMMADFLSALLTFPTHDNKYSLYNARA